MTVVRNDATHRFEVQDSDPPAFLTYRRTGNEIVLVHTEVPEALGGRGLGGELAKAALDYARENDLTVVPRCPFVRSYLERHPDEAATLKLSS